MTGFDFGGIFSSAISTDIGIGGTLFILILIGITSLAITTYTKHLKLTLLPVALGYAGIGLQVHAIILIALAILWVTTIVSAHEIGSMVGTIFEGVKTITIERKEKRKTRMRNAYNNEGIQLLGLRQTVPKKSKAEQWIKNADTEASIEFKKEFAKQIEGNSKQGMESGPAAALAWEEAKRKENMYLTHGIKPRRKQ